MIDGAWIFAAGVTAGIDGALRLAAEVRDDEAAQRIQLDIAYAPEPPFASGTPETAPTAIFQQARQSLRAITARREETARRIAAKLGIASHAWQMSRGPEMSFDLLRPFWREPRAYWRIRKPSCA